ncbi:6-hydroxymethylpterin diphosphokinase MptE-like protein [uncultured Anaeromusa sp.]|uniref:motility associated factor glycosyltransferase family protein n=1 Tax=uncultured Anaeromusa sp. TaxID=673273 RepID=UPI0029C628F9|nr:6-hydroxymethylpterin diphosphokinase MptE-like protein [uncultured Anaeromusa sp.]
MDIFEYNSLIVGAQKNYISEPNEDELKRLQFVAREKNIEWFFDHEGEKSYPVQDVLDSTQDLPNPKRREIIVVVGLNSIREIESLYGKMHVNSFMFVCEPNPSFVMNALSKKDMRVFLNPNIALLACSGEDLMYQLNVSFQSWLLLLLGNIKVYATHYYRNFAKNEFKEVLDSLALVASSCRWGAGNSIEDCLQGSSQVMRNLKYLPRSKDVRLLKGKFENIPCIIVSAGPSLEKNLTLLHQVKDKAIIIATETILERLLDEKIVPHFVTTMERIVQAYEYSYKGKVIPPEVTLIAPPLIEPKIFEEYKGNYIIPMREGVREFFWWNEMLELGQDANMMVGDSTAHLAFGFAIHSGANPIILMGQDLAYGEGARDHASGTVYDEIGINWQKDPMLEPSGKTEGYYGGEVISNQVWLNFKKWFEMYILHYKGQIKIINSTEGGAKIKGALQLPLQEAINLYCKEEIPIRKIIDETATYSLQPKQIKEKLVKAVKELKQTKKLAENVLKTIEGMKIDGSMTEAQLMQEYKKLKKSDAFLEALYKNNLLFHTVQPMIIHSFYRLYRIEENLNYKNIIENMDIQKELATSVVFGIDQLIKHMKETIEELANAKGWAQ